MKQYIPKILVVDDDMNIRSALKRSFLIKDWEVTCAASGADALDIINRSGSFDIIVADYFMPNVNGIEFLKRVNIQSPETYCIMLSAYPYCDSIKHALNKYLKAELMQKPWSEKLIESISGIVGLKQAEKVCQIS